MKTFLILFTTALICTSAQNQKFSSFTKGAAYFPRFTTTTYKPFKPVTFAPKVEPSRTSSDEKAEILRYESDLSPDGAYQYSFETSNGIAAEANGVPKDFGGTPPQVPVVSQGAFSWVDPEGKKVSFQYVADENGYQPSGDLLPSPPPIPPAILRALEYIRTHPSNEQR